MIYRYTGDGSPMGHLTLKSSPLCPNGGKLTSQYLIVDHLVAHYKKLNNVKPHVDTSPPKTWLASQKVRDRYMREALKTGILKHDWLLHSPLRTATRTVARRPSVPTSDFDRSDMLLQMQSLAHDNEGYGDLDGTLMSTAQKTRPPNGRARSARQYSETLTDRKTRSRSSARDYGERKKTETNEIKYLDDSDLMTTHKQVFTESKAFTPRTLRTNMSSRLVEKGYYNPPKQKKKKRTKENAVDLSTTKGLDETAGLADTYLTLRSYDGRKRSTPDNVPPLNISQDLDNQKWLEEQSRRSEKKQVDSSSTKRVAISLKTKPEVTQRSEKFSPTREKPPISARDEELLYLNFMKDVTADILDRGIFTNRALKQVFNSHVAKNQDDLNSNKMRDMIKELGTSLGIPEKDEEDGFGFTSSLQSSTGNDLSTSEPIVDSEMMMTRQTFDPKLFRSGRRGSKGHGLNTTNRPGLHDVQEVQEDDLSGESGRTTKVKVKNKEQEDNKRKYHVTGTTDDAFGSAENSAHVFDKLDGGLFGTTLVLSSEKAELSRPGEVNPVGELVKNGRIPSATKRRNGLERKNENAENRAENLPSANNSPADSLSSSPAHRIGKSPDNGSINLTNREDSRSTRNSPEPKPRGAKSTAEAPNPSPDFGDEDKRNSPTTRDQIAEPSSRVANDLDDESSLLDTLGEYQHRLEQTDNYDDDYDDDYESPRRSIRSQNDDDDAF